MSKYVRLGQQSQNVSPYTPPTPWQNTNSVYFNGTDTRLSGGTALNYSYTQPLTFSTWVRLPAGDTAKRSLMSRENYNADFDGYDMLLLGGTLNFYWANVWTSSTLFLWANTPVPNDGNTWVHLCVTSDGTGTAAGIKFYYDGVEQTSRTIRYDTLSGNPMNPTNNFWIGDALNGLTFYKGDMNNSAIIEACYSSAQINQYLIKDGKPADLSNAPNIAHWWQIVRELGANPDTTATIYDRIGSVNLTVNGTATITSAVP